MSANISSSEQAKFGFLVPVIFAAVLLLSALVLYLIFRRNRRTTVRVDAHTATATRTRTPLQRNIIPQRREHVEYRVDNSLSRHGETIDMKDKEDERLQLVLQSIICKVRFYFVKFFYNYEVHVLPNLTLTCETKRS
jgi:CBS-domain-containing membrane protein